MPDSAAFEIEVDCVGDPEDELDETFTELLTFDVEGGSQEVYIFNATACTVTETDDGGATSSSVSGGEPVFGEPIDLTSTVTNVFSTSTPAPTPPTPPSGAQPVVAPPAFTG